MSSEMHLSQTVVQMWPEKSSTSLSRSNGKEVQVIETRIPVQDFVVKLSVIRL